MADANKSELKFILKKFVCLSNPVCLLMFSQVIILMNLTIICRYSMVFPRRNSSSTSPLHLHPPPSYQMHSQYVFIFCRRHVTRRDCRLVIKFHKIILMLTDAKERTANYSAPPFQPVVIYHARITYVRLRLRQRTLTGSKRPQCTCTTATPSPPPTSDCIRSVSFYFAFAVCVPFAETRL